MILEVKRRIIFSAHRKPNIGLAARNGEGGKKPKQTAEERNSYRTRFLFFLPVPGAGACRGETWPSGRGLSVVCSWLQRSCGPQTSVRPQTLIPHCLSPWDQGTLRPAHKGGQQLGWQWYPRLTTSGGRDGVGKGRAK